MEKNLRLVREARRRHQVCLRHPVLPLEVADLVNY
jgi:hypothetical protein